jgi:hypothetical protein
MKYFKLLSSIIFSTCLLDGCSGNDAGKTNTINENGSGDASSPDVSFSVNIDDTAISGHGTDDMQLSNAAFIYPPKMIISSACFLPSYLIVKKMFYLIHAHSIFNGYAGWRFFPLCIKGSHSRHIFSYRNTVAGTFSGTLDLSGDTPRGTKRSVTLTNGKFDIPFSTGNVRPH